MADQPDPAGVRTALARVLASEGFRSSPRLSRFLEYVVEAALRGDSQSVKEYSVGIDVFNKPPSFDPRSDSTVRSEASKLRLRLRLYYETAGADDPILIELPKGGYSAVFRLRPRQKNHRIQVAAVIATAAIIPVVWWLARPDAPRMPHLTRITNDVGLTCYPAVSPRGDLLACASDRAGRGDLDIWVQPLPGGAPQRLTSGGADEYDPAFSPDGAWIAFRSEADGGGVYSIPSTGGQTRFIAAGGHHPRYSPDGAWIAYSVGTTRLHPTTPGASHMFVAPAHGGTPSQVQPEFLSAFHPIWSPDGKRLLFLGRPDSPGPAREELDWWVAPVEGGAAIRTGARKMFDRLGLVPPHWPRVPLTPSDWTGEHLLFSRRSKESANVWRAAISLRTFRIARQPERLTFGSGSEVNATLTPSGEIILADVRENLEIWSLPIDANHAQVNGSPERITHDAALDDWPSVSRDGKRLLYVSYSTGASEIWLKDFESGQHTPLTRDGAGKNWPEIAPDGSSYYFTRMERPEGVWWASLHENPRQLCTDCQALTPLSGGGFLHSNSSLPMHPHLMDSHGRSRAWLRHPTWNLHQPQPSPDERWVVFYASVAPQRSRIYVVRFRREEPPPPEEWIPINEDEFLETAPLWSPDGNRLYFGSNRDSFQCIWSVPLDPESKRPAGPPAPVAHFHTAAQPMGNVGLTRRGMSVAADKIVFTLAQRSGNLWRLEAP